jgi:hypothetical protein
MNEIKVYSERIYQLGFKGGKSGSNLCLPISACWCDSLPGISPFCSRHKPDAAVQKFCTESALHNENWFLLQENQKIPGTPSLKRQCASFRTPI